MKNILYISLFILGILIPKNLILHDYDNPSASHILDATIQDDLLIVSGMLGGIEFYDISNPETLNHLTNLQLSSGGGGGTKPNCIVTSGNYAYVTTNQGLGVINISNPNNLNLLSTISSNNAWSVRLHNGYAYIADEQSVTIYDVSNTASPNFVNVIETTNAVKDIALADSFMYVAIGSDGVNIYDLSDPVSPIFLDSFDTNTIGSIKIIKKTKKEKKSKSAPTVL